MITKDSKNILIADDSVFFRTKLSDILVEAGHKVKFAKDGAEVISEIGIDGSWINLLILDLQMPNVDGFGVLKWINENGYRGRFPILSVTGVYEPAEVIEKLKSLGASGLMTKGFTPEQIIYRINRLLFADKTGQRAIAPRVPVSLPVDFTVGDNTRTGFLLNLSESGTFLHTKVDLLPGTLVYLRFSLPGASQVFDVKGIVRWTTGESSSKTMFGGSGVMFTTISAQDQQAIKDFVASEAQKLGLDKPAEL